MPKFEEYAQNGILISVNTDGKDGGFVVEVGTKKPIVLSQQEAKTLSAQIGYAVEFVNLYDRGPR
jgi:hypothetical protein